MYSTDESELSITVTNKLNCITVEYVDPATGKVYVEKTVIEKGGKEPDQPANPTRDGYTFAGWKRVVDDDGNVIYSYEAEQKVQIFSKETCETLIGILAEGVATDGGAKNAYTKGYSVAAKTGTSQKQDKYVYYDAEGNVP